MLSRTADHLYWMARYTERAENTARMLDVNIQTQLLPFWRKRFQGDNMQSLIEETGLAAIEEHLRDNPRIAVMTNADDLILVPGDLAWLRAVFADRLTVYPVGGHLGNMNYRRNVADMLAFFHE